MKNDTVIPFSFEGKSVRVVTRNNEPHWMLTDVCQVLGITNTGNASSRLDHNEKATIHITDSGNLNAERTIINESGLWSLVLTSRKAEAKRFKKWLTSEVIPSIRKHGGYMMASQKEITSLSQESIPLDCLQFWLFYRLALRSLYRHRKLALPAFLFDLGSWTKPLQVAPIFQP